MYHVPTEDESVIEALGCVEYGAYSSHKAYDSHNRIRQGAFTLGLVHYCYLIGSVPNKGTTYIGYTTNISQRLRKHNGEIKGGAKKTSKDAPWKLLIVVKGFLCGTTARQFEFAWQRPKHTRHLKDSKCKASRPGAKKSMKQSVSILKSLLSEKNAMTKICRLNVIFIDKEATELWNKLNDLITMPYVQLDETYVLDQDEFLLHEQIRKSEDYILKNTMIRLNHPPVCTICSNLIAVNEAASVCTNGLKDCNQRSAEAVAHLKCLRIKIQNGNVPMAYSMLVSDPSETHNCWRKPPCGQDHTWSDIILHGGVVERITVKNHNDEIDLFDDEYSNESNGEICGDSPHQDGTTISPNERRYTSDGKLHIDDNDITEKDIIREDTSVEENDCSKHIRNLIEQMSDEGCITPDYY